MEASVQDIENLKRLQDVDVAAANAQRELDGLPERTQLADVRAKLIAIRQKQQEIEKLADSNRTELSRIGAEIEVITLHQIETNEKIGSSNSDHQLREALSKDLKSLVDRGKELEKTREAILARESQIANVKHQIETAIGALAAQESSISATLEAKISVLPDQLAEGRSEHERLIAVLPAEVAEGYERARRHCGGVALAELVDGQCSTCRSKLDDTRLLQVRRQAPLSVCPMCRRLLIIR